MATAEQKQELIDHLKGHRYYRVNLWGYGGEAAYIKLDEDSYNFWNSVKEEHGDSDLVSYMVSAEDADFELSDIDSIPENALFMTDEEGDVRPWYEHHNEFCHQWGVAYDSARFTVEEVDSDEYNAGHVADIIDGEDLQPCLDKVMEEHNYEIELTEMSVADGTDEQPEFVLQFYSAEKGTFFDGIIETVGDFDIRKLKVYTEEFPNGEDVVTSIEYDGKEVENSGGDTNGKGYSAYVWRNNS